MTVFPCDDWYYVFIYVNMCRATQEQPQQGARSTSNKNAGIPQWAVGCRNRRIPGIPQILPESCSTEIQRWAIICCTKFWFWKYQIIWIQTCLHKNYSLFCQGRLVCKLLDIFKTKNLVPQIIAHLWISVQWISGRICGILGIRRFWHPTAHCGIPAFSFEVDRASRTTRTRDICRRG